jgi:hypothetical protein
MHDEHTTLARKIHSRILGLSVRRAFLALTPYDFNRRAFLALTPYDLHGGEICRTCIQLANTMFECNTSFECTSCISCPYTM